MATGRRSRACRARLVRGKPLRRFGVSLLRKILGFLPVMCQPAGKIIEPLEVRHGQLIKRIRWQVLSDMHTRVNQPMIVLFP